MSIRNPTLLAAGLVLAIAAAPLAAWSQSTAMFGGDARHSGTYATAAPGNLEVLWSFQTREPIVSSPVVAEGTVYFGGSDNFLYALEAGTGKLRWKFDAHGNVGSSPAVSGGRVFVLSLDGNLYALDAATGAQQWVFATGGERRHTAPGIDYAAPATEMMPDPWDFLLSSPTVHAGVVYFGSGDHHVYAVDATTGALRWKFETGNVVHASPAVAEGRVFVGSFDARFYALDAQSGALLWQFQTGDNDRTRLMVGIPGSATVAGGTVYFGCRDANLYALDAASGELRWKYANNGSWVIATPVVFGEWVCFPTSDSLKFEVLDARTGASVYALPTPLYSFSSPAVAEGRAYFGCFDGKLREVDLAGRRYGAEFATAGHVANAARYLDAGGKLKPEAVWIGDTLDDTIVAVRTRLFSLGSIISTPAIHAGVLYVGSVDGTLYALGRPAEPKR